MKNLIAYMYGVRDGFHQPYDLGMSFNVDHLSTGKNNPYGAQDRGINLGQFLRAGRHSEAYTRYGYLNLPRRKATYKESR